MFASSHTTGRTPPIWTLLRHKDKNAMTSAENTATSSPTSPFALFSDWQQSLQNAFTTPHTAQFQEAFEQYTQLAQSMAETHSLKMMKAFDEMARLYKDQLEDMHKLYNDWQRIALETTKAFTNV